MKFGLLCLLILSLAGCSWHRREDEIHGPLRVQLPFAINGQYGLYVLDLTTLFNLENLEGSAARFLMEPAVQNGQITGSAPHIRYIRNSEGVVIPKDDLSTQLLTVYAHIERLQALDSATGAQGVLKYPRKVAINAQYRTSQGDLQDNALYSGTFDTLLVVPYTQQALPIMANGGILGHEHFHALFYHLFIAPLGEMYPNSQQSSPHPGRGERILGLTSAQSKTDSHTENPRGLSEQEKRTLYHSMVLRGLNEGLADIWGWVYSGDSRFVTRSLPQEKMTRNLDSPSEIIGSQNWYLNQIDQVEQSSELIGMSYHLGGQIARALKSFTVMMAGKSTAPDAPANRLLIGQTLLKALPELKAKFAALKKEEYLEPSAFLKLFIDQLSEVPSEACFHLLSLTPLQERTEDFKKKCSDLEKAQGKSSAVSPFDPNLSMASPPVTAL